VTAEAWEASRYPAAVFPSPRMCRSKVTAPLEHLHNQHQPPLLVSSSIVCLVPMDSHSTRSSQPGPSSSQAIEYKKDGSVSRMRAHRGNVPQLPQTKLCPFCPAKFTRTTHLNRHLRNRQSLSPLQLSCSHLTLVQIQTSACIAVKFVFVISRFKRPSSLIRC